MSQCWHDVGSSEPIAWVLSLIPRHIVTRHSTLICTAGPGSSSDQPTATAERQDVPGIAVKPGCRQLKHTCRDPMPQSLKSAAENYDGYGHGYAVGPPSPHSHSSAAHLSDEETSKPLPVPCFQPKPGERAQRSPLSTCFTVKIAN